MKAAVWMRPSVLNCRNRRYRPAVGNVGHELQAVLVGVHVQEGEVALAQRDQVALGAQVLLDRDRLAVARDVERQLATRRRRGSRPR